MTITKTYTDSKVVASVEYEEETQILQVEFITGKKWRYFDFPKQMWDDLLAAPSVGSFISKIKGHYRSEPI